ITHVHHFYTKRNLWAISCLWSKLKGKQKFLLTSALNRNLTKLNRYIFYKGKGGIGRPLSGTLYMPSENVEQSLFHLLGKQEAKFKILNYSLVSVSSLCSNDRKQNEKIPSNSIDYIFTDPPFGGNIMYSELNFITESWLKVKTNPASEAIINKTQGKGPEEYYELMKAAFMEYYRVLKPGKWMTVEFNNTKASIWMAIQNAIHTAGFVLANVAVLDKKHGGIKAMAIPTVSKQDLILSCYKPPEPIEEAVLHSCDKKFVWTFIRNLLEHLPLLLQEQGELIGVAERCPKVLYDRLVMYCLSHRRRVPLGARDFQEGLAQHFVCRQGLYYTPEQAQEYDFLLAQNKKIKQAPMFISNEEEGIAWLALKLNDKPQKLQDLQTEWKQILFPNKNEVIRELKEILVDNFIQEDGGYWRLPTVEESMLRKKQKEEKLAREFERLHREIQQGKKIEEVRREVLLFGIERFFEKEQYTSIIEVCKGLPKGYVEEDEQLFMYYEIANEGVKTEEIQNSTIQ
ncbi:MAG: DNA methyltransferase, partial [Bacteroidia bacterium]|nr:DNA methyltransferase [Bacteroidia bacterium]